MATIKKFQNAPFPVKPSKKLLDMKEISKNYGKDRYTPVKDFGPASFGKKSGKQLDPGFDRTPKTKSIMDRKFEDLPNASPNGKKMRPLKKGGSVKKASSMKMKNGGSMKKPLASGVAGKTPKAGMVDPKGAYTKVQTRTLGNMKRGGKMSKKK